MTMSSKCHFVRI